jgi:hypothetical protein
MRTIKDVVRRRPALIVHESVTLKRVLALAIEAMTVEKCLGLCIACGTEHEVHDLDTCGYRCVACAAMSVYSAEDLVLRLAP